jgi:phosphatidylglycerol:prolipoprotein diacylglycerol transferase
MAEAFDRGVFSLRNAPMEETTASLQATQYWVHDLDPFLWQIHGNIGIRWYGLAYSVGIVLAGLLLAHWSKKRRFPLAPNDAWNYLFIIAFGMFIGGRVGYCLFYDFRETLHNPIFLVQVWKGGMSSHGGILGMLVAHYIALRYYRCNAGALADGIAAAIPIGITFGRLANFINGELWGRPTTVPWAVIFPRAMNSVDQGMAVPRHPSQLYAALLEGILVLAIALPVHARHRKPWLTTGLVMATYSVGRFIDEFFREPDTGYALFFGWMSKGQLFTIPTFFLGVGLLIWAMRRPPQPEAYTYIPAEQSSKEE